jgi:hypothetical protein
MPALPGTVVSPAVCAKTSVAQQESTMKFKWIVFAGAALIAASSVMTADAALARAKHKVARHCDDRAGQGPIFYGFLFNPRPQPNGCAPAVYTYGRYVGQDPDPFIRQQLNRDPRTGYDPF